MKITRQKGFCFPIKLDKENDLLIIDPYMVNIEDVKRAGVKT